MKTALLLVLFFTLNACATGAVGRLEFDPGCHKTLSCQKESGGHCLVTRVEIQGACSLTALNAGEIR